MSKKLGMGFLFFSLLYIFALIYGVDSLWLLKIMPIVLLGVAVVKTKPSLIRNFLLLALFFSGCGDLLLAFDQFIFGVAAFLLAQLGYAFLFSRYWQGIQNRWSLSLLLIVYMLAMAWLLIPKLGELQIPVMAYLFAIGAMGLLAFQSSLPMRWAVLGAVLFIISDSFIAINKFICVFPLASYCIMASYYAAQYMLVTGFLNSVKNKKA
ncbi:lysoplasmalogenase [uncultured Paraglaciecola sp.]|uniref:lysoplasmalogenase n=1 Tax=uncultured Paraglaciecola sp. TaxID=1765024 RepID=UPI0030D90053